MRPLDLVESVTDLFRTVRTLYRCLPQRLNLIAEKRRAQSLYDQASIDPMWELPADAFEVIERLKSATHDLVICENPDYQASIVRRVSQ